MFKMKLEIIKDEINDLYWLYVDDKKEYQVGPSEIILFSIAKSLNG